MPMRLPHARGGVSQEYWLIQQSHAKPALFEKANRTRAVRG
jgi:hypothetical protein